mgnify:CR=1 FL=1
MDALLKDIPELTKILRYHLVTGKIMSRDALNLNSIPTLEGSALSIDASNGIKVNEATIVTPDVEADNGVIHVIDTESMT